MKNKNLFKNTLLRLFLVAAGLVLVCLGACKKPDKGGNDGDNIQPMYGVRVGSIK